MSKRLNTLFVVIILILTAVAAIAIVRMEQRYGGVGDMYDIRLKAETLYEEGDTDNAIYNMEVYCSYVSADTEAKAILGDWYMAKGDEERAYQCYYTAALNKGLSEERIPALGVKNMAEIILEPIGEVVIEITPDVRMTKDMYLTVTGHNLVPEAVSEGRINKLEGELIDEEGYYTTDWFMVDPEGEYLTMSGGFNHAIWQFKNSGGEITHYAVSTNTYRTKDSCSVNVYQMARASIPEKSAWCRVTYYNKSREATTASPEEELTIVYGRLPGESDAANYKTYRIPDLKEGESIIYADGVWKHVKDGATEVLSDWAVPDIERGSYVVTGGTLPGRVSFRDSTYADFSKDGIYSIRFDKNNPSATGERCDDARNLGFNAAVSQGTIALGENHFDNVYPWKDMRLCNIKDGRVVAYEGEEGFSADGTGGDVFVEIPKFYVRRVADERYDTISISGVKHEGFELDEAFLKANNEEADAVYVAAYITAVDENGEAVSRPDLMPVLGMTPAELKEKAESKGYGEIDYHTLAALQKLFMVETGLRNSQYLYLGACGYTTTSEPGREDEYALALTDNIKTNCIVVKSIYPFKTGNSVILFNSADYESTIESARQDIRTVKTVIANSDGSQSVYISGEPMDVTGGVTAIAHSALFNGTARSVAGHTGAVSTARGTVAFKYRGIENFWGNTFVYIDRVTVSGRGATIEKRNGTKITPGYMLPGAEGDSVTDNMVRSLGYDSENPLIMLPDSVGDGATISTYYGDAYTAPEEEGEYVLHYGGSWSSQGCAGLFNFNATLKIDEARADTSGRMMLVK